MTVAPPSADAVPPSVADAVVTPEKVGVVTVGRSLSLNGNTRLMNRASVVPIRDSEGDAIFPAENCPVSMTLPAASAVMPRPAANAPVPPKPRDQSRVPVDVNLPTSAEALVQLADVKAGPPVRLNGQELGARVLEHAAWSPTT